MTGSCFQFPSADGKSIIQAFCWEPETPPKAVIQIAHGITEHMGRYQAFARYFTDRGYAVVCHDQIGHGTSLPVENPKPMYLGPAGSWQFVVEDLKTCAGWIRQRFPGLKNCLLGFSMGSFAVRCLLEEAPELADLTIWAGTGQSGSGEIAFARAIAAMEERRFGETVDTPLLHKLTMGAYNQRFAPCRTGADWLCANEEAVDSYLADPLCGEGFTVSAFRELLTGMKRSGSDALVAKMRKSMPVLLISGKEDPVGKFGKGVAAVRRQLEKQGFTDVQMQLFDGMRHDLFREKECLSVFETMERWMAAR